MGKNMNCNLLVHSLFIQRDGAILMRNWIPIIAVRFFLALESYQTAVESVLDSFAFKQVSSDVFFPLAIP